MIYLVTRKVPNSASSDSFESYANNLLLRIGFKPFSLKTHLFFSSASISGAYFNMNHCFRNLWLECGTKSTKLEALFCLTPFFL